MKKHKVRNRVIKLLVVFLVLGGLAYFIKYEIDHDKFFIKGPEKVVEEKHLTVVDEDSTTRPYAVMIDNHFNALPHAGISNAYLSYEIIVEGGFTRIMALFKDQDVSKIGPVRSARPYYLDYALENDAIYAHYGASTQATKDIKSLDVDDISGLTNAYNAFSRDKTLSSPHNVFTTSAKLKDFTAKLGYETETNKPLVLNYTTDVINQSSATDSKIANEIIINYSNYQTTSYIYDSENKVYKRYSNDEPYSDKNTGKQFTVKNLIVLKVNNKTADNKGHQELDNIGTGDGYYITNGYSRPIKWTKTSRSAQTTYKYSDGTAVKINDGNTFINIHPIKKELIIS